MRITNQRLMSSSNQTERHHRQKEAKEIMDAKWNNIIDNALFRTTLLVLGFGVWLAISYGLLSL